MDKARSILLSVILTALAGCTQSPHTADALPPEPPNPRASRQVSIIIETGGPRRLSIPMPTALEPLTDPALEPIRERVLAGERLTIDQGRTLYTTPDVWSVCELAHAVRTRLHGDIAYYNINRHMNYSNVCALSCRFWISSPVRLRLPAATIRNFPVSSSTW